MQSTFLVKFKNLGKSDDHVQCDKNEIEIEWI